MVGRCVQNGWIRLKQGQNELEVINLNIKDIKTSKERESYVLHLGYVESV